MFGDGFERCEDIFRRDQGDFTHGYVWIHVTVVDRVNSNEFCICIAHNLHTSRICHRRSRQTGCTGPDPANFRESNMGPSHFCVAKYNLFTTTWTIPSFQPRQRPRPYHLHSFIEAWHTLWIAGMISHILDFSFVFQHMLRSFLGGIRFECASQYNILSRKAKSDWNLLYWSWMPTLVYFPEFLKNGCLLSDIGKQPLKPD